jgi:glycosyltransferase involved in cell wall biosynthesis
MLYNKSMRISNGTRHGELSEHNGYGYAGTNMLKSLARLGYEVNPNDPTADVEIWFDQPMWWDFSPGTYKIGYHPWESTKLPIKRDKNSGNMNWADKMNECDEIWTPSPLIAEWYVERMGIKVPVYVYEHGVEPIWTPVKRERGDGLFKYLHVGAEASRKGAKEAMVAFRTQFGADRGKTVQLDMKMISEGWSIITLPGINYINDLWSIEQLIELYHRDHVFLYPSYGEGFGLNPLQALATGMPTIIPPAWAPYAKYIHPKLAVESNLQKTPWPNIHPGSMFKPNQDSVNAAVRYAYDNYEELVEWHVAQVPALTAEYSWDTITERVFTDLENRLQK